MIHGAGAGVALHQSASPACPVWPESVQKKDNVLLNVIPAGYHASHRINRAFLPGIWRSGRLAGRRPASLEYRAKMARQAPSAIYHHPAAVHGNDIQLILRIPGHHAHENHTPPTCCYLLKL